MKEGWSRGTLCHYFWNNLKQAQSDLASVADPHRGGLIMNSSHLGVNRCFKVHGWRWNFPATQVHVKLGKHFSQEGGVKGQSRDRMNAGLTLLEHPESRPTELYVVCESSCLMGASPFGLETCDFFHIIWLLSLALQNEVHAFHYVCLMQKPNRKREH